MICAIMQPTYNPWLGYFDMIDKVDIFVFLDDVQLAKRSWQVRNRIKGANGEIWLTIPIKKTAKRDEIRIKDALPNYEQNWTDKHLKTIEHNYKKAKYFNEVFPFIENHFSKKAESLAEFNSQLIMDIAKKIGTSTVFKYSSQLNVEGNKDVKLVNICKKLDTEEYLSPQGSAVYINQHHKGGEFVTNNIDLYYHDYEHPVYKQLYGEFLPYMGILDLLMNEGFEKSLEIIQAGRKENIHYLNF